MHLRSLRVHGKAIACGQRNEEQTVLPDGDPSRAAVGPADPASGRDAAPGAPAAARPAAPHRVQRGRSPDFTMFLLALSAAGGRPERVSEDQRAANEEPKSCVCWTKRNERVPAPRSRPSSLPRRPRGCHVLAQDQPGALAIYSVECAPRSSSSRCTPAFGGRVQTRPPWPHVDAPQHVFLLRPLFCKTRAHSQAPSAHEAPGSQDPQGLPHSPLSPAGQPHSRPHQHPISTEPITMSLKLPSNYSIPSSSPPLPSAGHSPSLPGVTADPLSPTGLVQSAPPTHPPTPVLPVSSRKEEPAM